MRAYCLLVLSVLAFIAGCAVQRPPPKAGPSAMVTIVRKSEGCFKDQGDATGTDGRDLSGFALNLPLMTISLCIEECEHRDFSYAGVQYGKWCFCGNSYGTSGAATNCDMRCGGASQEICGGAWANKVFATRHAAAIHRPTNSGAPTVTPSSAAGSATDSDIRADGCPFAYGALLGKPCLAAQEGKSCGPEHPEKMDGWVNLVQCSGGIWLRLEAPPRPR